MKKINLMTLKEYFQRIMDREGRYSVIYLIKATKKQPVRITKNKNCIEVVEVKIDEYCDFTPYMAEKILRFCERQIDVDDVIIVYDVEKSLAENIAEAIENAYGIAEHETPFENIIFRFIRLKSYEINNSLIKHLPPMEYCKMIIKFTAQQIEELKKGICEAGYGPSEFFWYRQCEICLKNGTRITWHLELCFDEIIIPDLDEIEYVKFYHCVPEIASPASFYDENYYSSDCIYGLYDHYNGKMEFDSVNGIIKTMALPEKYKEYAIIE